MNIDNNHKDFIKYLWIFAFSFISAFVKQFHTKVYNGEKFIFFISDTLLHGICGVLVGTLVMHFTNDMYIISFCSGVAGLLGMSAIKIITKYAYAYYIAVKKVDLSSINIDKELDKIDGDKDIKDKVDDNKNK